MGMKAWESNSTLLAAWMPYSGSGLYLILPILTLSAAGAYLASMPFLGYSFDAPAKHVPPTVRGNCPILSNGR
jgi:hypothetical protein